jgi:predicted SAM-dependent methyltransferase
MPRPIRGSFRTRGRAAKAHIREREFAAAVIDAGTDLRLHVGAGSVVLAEWLNTDIDGSARLFLDATRPWPVGDGSVSFVFADNFIEHLALDDARQFLTHARAALRPGGILRLVTPDVRSTARAYVEGNPALDAMLERHRRHGYRVEHGVDVLRIVFATGRHWEGYLYDEDALTTELRNAGFVDIQVCHVGESTHPELRALELRSEPIDDSLQLVLEASAPGS